MTAWTWNSWNYGCIWWIFGTWCTPKWQQICKSSPRIARTLPNMFSLDLSGAKKSSPKKISHPQNILNHLKPTKAKGNDWCFKPQIAPSMHCHSAARTTSHPFWTWLFRGSPRRQSPTIRRKVRLMRGAVQQGSWASNEVTMVTMATQLWQRKTTQLLWDIHRHHTSRSPYVPWAVFFNVHGIDGKEFLTSNDPKCYCKKPGYSRERMLPVRLHSTCNESGGYWSQWSNIAGKLRAE